VEDLDRYSHHTGKMIITCPDNKVRADPGKKTMQDRIQVRRGEN
jgi:hypothetical protein